MPVINNVEIFYPRLHPEHPEQYEGKGPMRWRLQIRTRDEAESKVWAKDYGMSVKMDKDDAGIFWKAAVAAKAYDAVEGSNGQVDDKEKPRVAPRVMLANGDALDPFAIGNGSVGSIAFGLYVDGKERYRTLKTIAIRKLLKRPVRDDDTSIPLSDDIEIIEETDSEDSLVY
jgi:hypothetical protein